MRSKKKQITYSAKGKTTISQEESKTLSKILKNLSICFLCICLYHCSLRDTLKGDFFLPILPPVWQDNTEAKIMAQRSHCMERSPCRIVFFLLVETKCDWGWGREKADRRERKDLAQRQWVEELVPSDRDSALSSLSLRPSL